MYVMSAVATPSTRKPGDPIVPVQQTPKGPGDVVISTIPVRTVEPHRPAPRTFSKAVVDWLRRQTGAVLALGPDSDDGRPCPWPERKTDK
jgi:hypothetical protein